jgi:hypothetical protein
MLEAKVMKDHRLPQTTKIEVLREEECERPGAYWYLLDVNYAITLQCPNTAYEKHSKLSCSWQS